MAQPTSYTPTTDFSQDEADTVAGRSTVRTPQLDAEFSNIQTTLDQILSNLAILQRDDTKLGNGTVHPDAFTTAALALLGSNGWLPRGAWVTATAYAVKDVVEQGGDAYVCASAHTSGTFATDYAAARWIRISQLSYSVLASTANGNGASLVGVQDAAAYFAAANVEAVLAEMWGRLIATTANNGASIIGVQDAATNFVATNVETVLAEIATNIATRAGLGLSNTFTAGNTFAAGARFNGAVIMTPVTTGGAANAYTATVGETAYATGKIYDLLIHATNTAASTINLDSLGVKNVKLINGNDPYPGALKQNVRHFFRYDGTNLVVLNPEKLFRAMLVRRTPSQTINNSVDTNISFDAETYDAENWHSTSTNPDRLIVPAGASYVKITAYLAFAANATGTRSCFIKKNGSAITNGAPLLYNTNPSGSFSATFNLSTAALSVVGADYFTIVVNQNSGAGLNVEDAWAYMEVVE